MTKEELIKELAAATGCNRADTEKVLSTLGVIGGKQLAGGGALPLPGLGKLAVTQRAARKGRNPRTGAEIEIPAKKAVKFTVAKALKDAVQ